ncbi:MAG TPA: amino acid permease [Thermoanaerobaculia bacterium]|nr:amino acid permease [Thermoanaerobaculia bacterium]
MTMPGDAAAPATLRRELGLIDAVGIGLGAVVGAGIYVVTGIAAGIAGPAFLVGLVIAGVVAAANALSSAQLAARYPASGGTYEYGYEVLGPRSGFAAGWMFLASKIAAAGTVAIGLGAYVELLAPALEARAIAVGAIVVFTAIHYRGIRKSSRANLLIVAASTGALVLFALLGAPRINPERFAPFAPNGWAAVLEAAALLFFAYTGYARIATLGGEVADPARNIPRAIIITIAGAIALYLAVAVVAVGTVGAAALGEGGAPLGVAADAVGGSWLRSVVAAGALAAMLGVILSQLLGLSRMAFAMARRGDLPSPLATVHPRFGVPSVALLAVGAVAAVVAATGSLRAIASAAAFTILVYYAITNLAALRMPERARRYSPIVPWFGLAGCALLAVSLSPRVVTTGLATLLAGFLFRAVLHRISPAGRRDGTGNGSRR